jgi:hypothetical protein
MKKTKQPIVLEGSDELRMCIANALAFHKMAQNSASQAVLFAAKCGSELLHAKELCEHGQFGKWIAKNIPEISNGTMHRYMELAQVLQKKVAKFPTVGNLQSLNVKDLPDVRDPKSFYKNPIVEAVQKVTDGKTLNRLYEEFGIIKPRQQKKSIELDERVARSERAVADKVPAHQIGSASAANLYVEEVIALLQPGRMSFVQDHGTDEDLTRLANMIKEAAAFFGLKCVHKNG